MDRRKGLMFWHACAQTVARFFISNSDAPTFKRSLCLENHFPDAPNTFLQMRAEDGDGGGRGARNGDTGAVRELQWSERNLVQRDFKKFAHP